MHSEKILIRTPNWLGDLMMSTAFIRVVLERYPHSSVDLVVKKGFENIPLPQRGNILPFDKESMSAFRFGKTLKEYCYDRIFVLPPSFSSALMALGAGIPKRFGYSGNMRGMLLNQVKSYQQKHRTQHLVSEYLQLLDRNLSISDMDPGLDVDQEWIEITLGDEFKYLPESYLCLAPGVIYGPAKQWPVEYFRELAASLVKKGENLVIIGTKDDVELGDFLREVDENIISLCGRTNLTQLIAILAQAKALISNDSGTMHVMAALQKPQVAIFGSTSTIWTGPLNRKAEIIDLKIECSPCFKRECRFGHYDCLRKISPQLVLKKLASALEN
jgi:lipopolysaccharide heptosyltransferase II